MTSAQGYSDRLSPYDNKGNLNLQHEPEPAISVLYKALHLAKYLEQSKHAIIHTGAGISTAAGIPDFRGPSGVWTTENQQERPAKRQRTVSFEDALPTLTHSVMTALNHSGNIQHIISQNVDALHLRSCLPRCSLSELHGNLFIDWCPTCKAETLRNSEATTVGLKRTGRICKHCGKGRTTDKALDWEDELPEPDYRNAKRHADAADMHIVAGTSCQMEPARGLPFRNPSKSGSGAGCCHKAKRMLINLSRTELDDKFGTIIRSESDVVFAVVAHKLGIESHLKNSKRIALLAFRAIRSPVCESGNDDVISIGVRMKWNGEWVSRKVTGVTGIRYCLLSQGGNDVDKEWSPLFTNAGFEAELKDTSENGGKYYSEVEVEIMMESSDISNVRLKVQVNDNDSANYGQTVEGPEKKECWDGCFQKEVTTGILRHDMKIKELVQKLKQKAEIEMKDANILKQLTVEQMFVSGMKRGWAVCVLCYKEVWCGKGLRERHVHECVRSFPTKKSRHFFRIQ